MRYEYFVICSPLVSKDVFESFELYYGTRESRVFVVNLSLSGNVFKFAHDPLGLYSKTQFTVLAPKTRLLKVYRPHDTTMTNH